MAWIGEDWRRPLAGLVHSKVIGVVSPQRAAGLVAAKKEAEAFLARQPKGARTVGVYVGNAPWADDLVQVLGKQAKGYTVRHVPDRWFENPYALVPRMFDMIVLCNPEAVPVGAKQALPRYVSAGGRLVVLGALPFRRALWQYKGEWLEFDAFRERLVPELKPTHCVALRRRCPHMEPRHQRPGACFPWPTSRRGCCISISPT